MSVSRLQGMMGIGVDRMGDLADREQDSEILRLENLDTDVPPPPGVVEATRRAAGRDDANSYLPFFGFNELRRAAAEVVSATSGVDYDWNRTTLISAGGLTGIFNTLLALLEPGDEVILPDPIYIGLVNRVRLAGGVPVFLPCEIDEGVWRLDRDALPGLLSPKTRMFLMMSPAMPSGAVFTREDWQTLCDACVDADAWMLYDSAMERILYDDAEHVHPASFPGMKERTITVGAASKEYRMIGWRIGWITAPPEIVDDIGLVNISNVVCNVGIAQEAAITALRAPESDIEQAVARWRGRRDVLLRELEDLPIVRPQGGWSMLFDVSSYGLTAAEASERLFKHGKIAATPMDGWGTKRSSRFVRFVFSNEPAERLQGVRERIERSLPR